MPVYNILRDSEHFKHIQFDIMEMVDAIGPKVGQMKFMHFSKYNLSLAEYWQPFSGKFVIPEGLDADIEAPDVTTWRLADLLLSESAMKVLEEPLKPYGEFLPVVVDGAPHFIFNCLTDAKVDESKSEREMMDGIVTDILKFVFDEHDIRDKLIFKCIYEGGTSLYCTDTFKKLVERHQLKGLTFSEDLLEIFG